MTRKPLVSVLLPYRKKNAFLASALASLEKQTYSRIEILALEDTRAEGITVLLNRLAHRARGEFLARMDADDISEPDRFAKQIEFLRKHPDVMLVGSWATLIDEKGRKIGIQKMPIGWEKIKLQAFDRNPLIHPTWMMRRKWYEKIGGYDSLYRFSQDWELILRRVWYDRIENIPEALIRLRIHRASSSFSSNKEQLYFGLKAQLGALARKEVPISKGVYLLSKIFSFFIPTSMKFRLKHL